MTPRQLRTLRGAAAVGIATVIAATAHTLSGGGAPAPGFVLAIGILAWPLGIALIGRKLSSWRLGSVVVASQALFHVAFSITASADPHVMAGHIHPGSSLVASGHAHTAMLPEPPMMFGHIMAAGLTTLVLFTGERMLRAVAAGIRSVLRRAETPLPPVTTRPARPVVLVLPARTRARVLTSFTRRGPPALVAAC